MPTNKNSFPSAVCTSAIGGIGICLYLSQARGWTWVDPLWGGALISNLLGNALAHTPAGGSVAVATSVDGAVSTLTVTDTGRGISAEDLPLIFDRFYRADLAPVATMASGRGLGLTIARGLARAHGGDIAAASAGRDRGAAFTLTMPSAKPAAPLDRR